MLSQQNLAVAPTIFDDLQLTLGLCMQLQHESSAVQIQVIEDRTPLARANLPVWLERELASRDLLTTDRLRISFCGLMAADDEVFFFCPRGLGSSVKGLGPEQGAAITMAAIEKYARVNKAASLASGIVSQEIVTGRDRVALYREILADFREHGIYVSQNRQQVRNPVKIDWSRTIRRSTPILDKNGRPVFLSTRGSAVRYTSSSGIADIHRAVVARLDRKFGWWLTGEGAGRLAESFQENDALLQEISYCESVLHQELRLVFSDRNVRLLSNLLRYMNNSETAGPTPVVVGVKDFHRVWEHMLAVVLGDNADLKKAIPFPVYHFVAGRIPAPEKGMRVDIIIENLLADEILVIDAKYYEATTLTDSPGWPDLVKQFFYAKAFEVTHPERTVKNIFVFPGDIESLELITVERRENHERLDEIFPPIICVYITVDSVMREYLHMTCDKSAVRRLLFDRIANSKV